MPIVNGPEGPIRFPDNMSDEEIEEVMRREYPPAEGRESSTVGPIDTPGDPARQTAFRSANEFDQDISQSIIQGLRDTGEYIEGGPKFIDDLERLAIKWLKTWRPDPGASNWFSEGAADIANKVGDFWEATTPLPEESTLLKVPEGSALTKFTNGVADIPAPNFEEADWLYSQLFGPDYQPQTGAGEFARNAMPGALAFGALMPGRGVLGPLVRHGKWPAGIAGGGALWQGGGDLYKTGKEFLLGPPMHSNPALAPAPPIR